VPSQPDGGGGGGNAIFSWRKSRSAFGQPAFFLAGNRISTVAFKKEGFFLKLILFSKMTQFDRSEV